MPLHFRISALGLASLRGARGYRAAQCTELAKPLILRDLPAPPLQPHQVGPWDLAGAGQKPFNTCCPLPPGQLLGDSPRGHSKNKLLTPGLVLQGLMFVPFSCRSAWVSSTAG